ncbi:hypothetical protein PMAYCL1PPCAC_32347 [Pristionchus mayeri]|uniref:Uncharacterized protein n=1 Tax=Pristionchus mayeri TaxID=1317129 RepID=A0AAN5DHG8_9BILA|nr:hypothetical protein PMAYCL1PPCAC_32347 [Pristionchus mayeri]
MVRRIKGEASSAGFADWIRDHFGVIAGVAGAAFVAYVIYYDRRLQPPPIYQETLRPKRRRKARSGARTPYKSAADLLAPSTAAISPSAYLQKKTLGEESRNSLNCLSERFVSASVLDLVDSQERGRIVFTVSGDDDDDVVVDDRPLRDHRDMLLHEPHQLHLPMHEDEQEDDGCRRGFCRHGVPGGLAHSASFSGVPVDAARCGTRAARPQSVAKVVRAVFSSHFLPRL